MLYESNVNSPLHDVEDDARGLLFRDRVDHGLRSAQLARWLALATMAIALPSLATGVFMDDRWVEVNVRRGASALGLCIASVETMARAREIGGVAWWGSSELSARFLRPLASIMHWAEFSYFPHEKWAMHALNILTYGMLIWVATQTYRRLRLDPRVAGLAALMYALDDAHAMSVVWIVARNTLLVALFGFAALHQHVKARQASSTFWVPTTFASR